MIAILWIWVSCQTLALGIDYVPLNSLTIEKLFKDNETQNSQTTWWKNLQEQREQIKAAKIRAQQLSFDNGKIINMKRLPEAARTSMKTEFPRPITTPIPNEGPKEWPTGTKGSSGEPNRKFSCRTELCGSRIKFGQTELFFEMCRTELFD